MAPGDGFPLAIWTWIGSPFSFDQKNTRYPPTRNKLGTVHPSLRRIAVEQMGVVAQKFIKERHFVRRESFRKFPLIRWEYTSGRVKSSLRGALKVDFHTLVSVRFNQLGVCNLGFIRQRDIRIHHIDSALLHCCFALFYQMDRKISIHFRTVNCRHPQSPQNSEQSRPAGCQRDRRRPPPRDRQCWPGAPGPPWPWSHRSRRCQRQSQRNGACRPPYPSSPASASGRRPQPYGPW